MRKGDTFHLEEELKLSTAALEAKNAFSVIIYQLNSYTEQLFLMSVVPQHTPLYVACEKGEVACVKVLLSFGACLKYTHHGDRFSCLNAAIDANRR